MSGDEEVELFTRIHLPREAKAKLRLMCRREGIAMRDYVERLVRSALALHPLPSGGIAMATQLGEDPEQYEEPRRCKFGCSYQTRSVAALARHELSCTYQRSRRALHRARAVDRERRTAQAVLA